MDRRNRERSLASSDMQTPFEDDDEEEYFSVRKTNRERIRVKEPRSKRLDPERETPRRSRKPDGSESFRCRHCHNMVGPTISGGRHRNHCPLCLYSLHVDGKTPGDRASECRSLMAPIGLFVRPSGEEVIVHRCLGCGFERFNRVAADDSPIVVMQLQLVESINAELSDDRDDHFEPE